MAEEEEPDYLPSFIHNENQLLPEPDSDYCNGLLLHDRYIPEEVMLQIFSYIEADKLLSYSLVCRKWNNLIKSYALWSSKYKNKYKRKAKHLPWYVYYCILSTNYFDTNLVKNGNGENNFEHWQIVVNGGDHFSIENPPLNSDCLPPDVPEFNGHSSCFVSSFGDCHKTQAIELGKSKLFHYVMNSYKPHIYISEWMAARFDCGCLYILRCGFAGANITAEFLRPCAIQNIEQWNGRKWEKIEMTITSYPENVESLLFEHIGRDTQFWKGHYGSKMAGGVVKILSDSIEPLSVDAQGNYIPKTFSHIVYTSNGLSTEEKSHYKFFLVYNNARNVDEDRYSYNFYGIEVEDHDYYR